MAPTACAKFQYVVTSNGPRILPVEDSFNKDEESPADYNAGGYLAVKVGDTFKNGRYLVIRKLGWGHFSTVWLVNDTHIHRHSALKVVKSAGRYAETARDEIKLLSRVASASPEHPGRSHIVSFLDSFVNQGPESSHVCIVFEPLGENLLAIIERNKKKGLPKPFVKVIAKQILLGLQYLHDECDLVHTDIKPENILISIPDVETHIHTELSQSPTPTSRRVGVPPPAKSRGGVAIPRGHQRTRRQVQIFDSQPLSSPGRNTSRPVSGGSGSNSLPGSYVAQMQMSKLAGPNSTPASADLPATALKPTTNNSESFSANDSQVGNPLSPSTSSSSLSSTEASTNTGSSSITSTPPTSLSHSLGSIVAGFMAMSKISSSTDTVPNEGSKSHVNADDLKDKYPVDDQGATSTSWRDRIVPPSLFSHKLSPSGSLSSKYPPSGHGRSKLCQVHSPHLSQPRAGVPSSSFWKDPGTGNPAPAVVVSAVAGADDPGNPFNIAISGQVGRPTASESSSATATVARPSPIGTPVEPWPQSDIQNYVVDEAKPDGIILTTGANANHTQTAPKSHPSLLTQTAPLKVVPSQSSQPSSSRVSPSHPLARDSSNSVICSPPNSLNLNTLPSKGYNNARTDPERTSVHVDLRCPALTLNPSTPPPTPVSSTSTSLVPSSSRSSAPTIHLPVTGSFVSPPSPSISIKIADLGNATPSTKHYTEDIQTRQYRAPEAILGRRDWDARADIWSVACVIFELLTAEFLFDPHGQGELFTKDDDHMAQIIELLGDFPLEVKMGGKYSRDLFDHSGCLRYIHSLKPWPLKRVMMEKYFYSEADAKALSDFLLPMLVVDMRERKHARDMLNHTWLTHTENDEAESEW